MFVLLLPDLQRMVFLVRVLYTRGCIVIVNARAPPIPRPTKARNNNDDGKLRWIHSTQFSITPPAASPISSAAFGLNNSQAESVIAQLVPPLAAGVQKNKPAADGLAGLTRALQSGNHERCLDEPESLADSGATADDIGILGPVLGSKHVSRQVAAAASAETGVDVGIIKQMLPLVATLVMGGLSKQTGRGERLQDSADRRLLGSFLAPRRAAGSTNWSALRANF